LHCTNALTGHPNADAVHAKGYTEDRFSDSFISTIGVDFQMKSLDMDGRLCKLMIWDTAGQERFRTITSSYYHGAHGIIVVYDVTDSESFDHVTFWIREIAHYANKDIVKILVGNKSDAPFAKRQVTYEQGKLFADSLGLTFIETSARKDNNVDLAFVTMTAQIKQKNEKIKLRAPQDNGCKIPAAITGPSVGTAPAQSCCTQ